MISSTEKAFTGDPSVRNRRTTVRGERLAENQTLFRGANERLKQAVDPHVVEAQRVPFLCECADPLCRGRVDLTLEQYSALRARENRFAIVPGHPRVDGEEVVEHYEGFHVVEKPGTL
jgi:hypothetical protein